MRGQPQESRSNLQCMIGTKQWLVMSSKESHPAQEHATSIKRVDGAELPAARHDYRMMPHASIGDVARSGHCPGMSHRGALFVPVITP